MVSPLYIAYELDRCLGNVTLKEENYEPLLEKTMALKLVQLTNFILCSGSKLLELLANIKDFLKTALEVHDEGAEEELGLLINGLRSDGLELR
jgi:hypothetical protein